VLRRPCFPRGTSLAQSSAIGCERQPDQECRNGDNGEATAAGDESAEIRPERHFDCEDRRARSSDGAAVRALAGDER
jgi:hypothetical protein